MKLRSTCWLAVVLFTGLAPAARAQDKAPAPESFLPADAIAYLRYDGYARHKIAYDKSALAKVMKEGLGEFLEYSAPYLVENVFRGGRFFLDRESKLAKAPFPQLLDYVWQNGILIGFDVPDKAAAKIKGRRDIFHVDGLQATIVFPQGAEDKNKGLLTGFLESIAELTGGAVAQKKAGKRTLYHAGNAEFHAVWWSEGPHLVLSLGTLPIERVLDVFEGRRPNLAASAAYKAMIGFDRYETDVRGYVDVEKLVDILKTPQDVTNPLAAIKEALKRQVVLNQLGLTGLKGLSFHLGFEDKYQRHTVVLEVAEPTKRPGLLRLVTGPASVEAKDLPPMPPDASSIRVHHVDWDKVKEIYTEISRLKDLAGAFRDLPFRGRLLGQILALDVDLGKEVLPHLDSTLVAYNALSEGPFFLGQVFAIKVKDAAGLQKGMTALQPALVRAFGWEGTSFQPKTFRGVNFSTLESTRGRNFHIPLSYTIHKGWLVVSPFPQAIKGYILRSEGTYQVWKAPPITKEALDLAKKAGGANSKLIAAHFVDPKLSTEVGLAILPTIAHVAQSFNRGGDQNPFDISKIPNAQAVTEWLLPNVSLTYDDGNAIRWEMHSSIDVPFEEMLFFFGFVGFLFA